MSYLQILLRNHLDAKILYSFLFVAVSYAFRIEDKLYSACITREYIEECGSLEKAAKCRNPIIIFEHDNSICYECPRSKTLCVKSHVYESVSNCMPVYGTDIKYHPGDYIFNPSQTTILNSRITDIKQALDDLKEQASDID